MVPENLLDLALNLPRLERVLRSAVERPDDSEEKKYLIETTTCKGSMLRTYGHYNRRFKVFFRKKLILKKTRSGVCSAVMRSLKICTIINALPNCAFDPTFLCCAAAHNRDIAINNFRIFWGSGNECILWLKYILQRNIYLIEPTTCKVMDLWSLQKIFWQKWRFSSKNFCVKNASTLDKKD
jgi:hypothetical protein